MHEEMQQSQPVSSAYGTTTPTNVDKEEQLWAQQRLVTALKRKVFRLFNKSGSDVFVPSKSYEFLLITHR